jgi:uncharacterized protein (DUF433 family)
MQAVASPKVHIDETGKRPVVAGTDIKASQIASESELLGMSPDEIVEAHPHLTLADVHAALAYYYDHGDAIRAEWDEGRALVDSLRQQFPSRIPSRRK